MCCCCLYAQVAARSSRPAFLDDLEVYIEGLYEDDLPQRAAAAGMLCQLFKNSSNMQVGDSVSVAVACVSQRHPSEVRQRSAF
jgi:hypothetical protein